MRGCTSIADLLALEPEFVISAVPWAVNPGIVLALASAGVRVLSETPPAPDLEGLRSLWKQAGEADLVQVAEQYLLYPGHAARSALLATGLLGRPSSVQVSSTHLYHAVSMIRGFLGVGLQDATVRASTFHGPLVDPQTKRQAWTDDDTEKDAATTLATIEFASGAMGSYDFTDNQWHNPLRSRRIVIRASRGEISNDAVVRDWRTAARSSRPRSFAARPVGISTLRGSSLTISVTRAASCTGIRFRGSLSPTRTSQPRRCWSEWRAGHVGRGRRLTLSRRGARTMP